MQDRISTTSWGDGDPGLAEEPSPYCRASLAGLDSDPRPRVRLNFGGGREEASLGVAVAEIHGPLSVWLRQAILTR